MNTAAKILDQLSHYDPENFPEEAFQAASEHREEIASLLLEKFQSPVFWKELAKDEEAVLHIHGAYVLAEFREERAFQSLLDSFIREADSLAPIWGDVLTLEAPYFLASLGAGHVATLEKCLTAPNVGEDLRGAILQSLEQLFGANELSKADLSDLVGRVLEGFSEGSDFLWAIMARLIGKCGLTEHLPAVYQAYDADLIDDSLSPRETIEANPYNPEKPLALGLPASEAALYSYIYLEDIEELEDEDSHHGCGPDCGHEH